MIPIRQQTITIKQSASFSYAGTIQNLGPGAWTATSSIRTQDGELVEDLSVTMQESGTAGDWLIYLSATPEQSALWPLGQLQCDIRLEKDGMVIISPVFNVLVQVTETLQ